MQNHKDTLQFDILVNGPEANNLRDAFIHFWHFYELLTTKNNFW